jgi:hypothetical protein
MRPDAFALKPTPPPQVPLWSRIGRLKRQTYPKLTGGGHNFGGGASAGVMSAVAGRLLCDTYLICKCREGSLSVWGRYGTGDRSTERHGVGPFLDLDLHLDFRLIPESSPPAVMCWSVSFHHQPISPDLPSAHIPHEKNLFHPSHSHTLARELVREVDYTLRTLSSSLLGQAREELAPSDVPRRYESREALVGLCRHAESDAWLALGIMFHLSGVKGMEVRKEGKCDNGV